jgi:hypothetical protein
LAFFLSLSEDLEAGRFLPVSFESSAAYAFFYAAAASSSAFLTL